VSSFRATLQEIRDADCLLQIIDVTSPEAFEQAEAVEEILAELEITGLPVIKVFNKIDLLPATEKNLLLSHQSKDESSPVYTSARTGEGLDSLKDRLRQVIYKNFKIYRLYIPKDKAAMAGSLIRQVMVIRKTETAEGWEYQVLAQKNNLFSYLPYLRKGESL